MLSTRNLPFFPLDSYSTRILMIKNYIKGRMLRGHKEEAEEFSLNANSTCSFKDYNIENGCGGGWEVECIQKRRKRDQISERNICSLGSLLGCLRLDFSFNLSSKLLSRQPSLHESFLPGCSNCLFPPPFRPRSTILIPKLCIITFLECAFGHIFLRKQAIR